MPEKIAERRKLTTIAAVIPTLGLLWSFNHYWLHVRWYARGSPIAAVAVHGTRRGWKTRILGASKEVSVSLQSHYEP